MKKLLSLLSVLFLIYWGCSNNVKYDDLRDVGEYKFHNDKPYVGNIEKISNDGKVVFKGQYSLGLRDGEWIFYDEQKDNIQIVVNYSIGKKLREYQVVDGIKNGLFSNWNREGIKTSSGYYKNGNLDGLLSISMMMVQKRWNQIGLKEKQMERLLIVIQMEKLIM